MALPIDITSDVASALVEIWEMMADEPNVLFSCVMKFRPAQSYDPASGVNTPTWGATVSDKKVFKWDQKQTRPEAGDRRSEGQQPRLSKTKIIVRQVDVGAEVPAADSLFEIGGETWKVAEVETPPTATFWIITLRK